MKKLLVLTLVLGMVSAANATVIDLVADGVGDMGHSGTAGDPLSVGETLRIQIVLNKNPYPGASSYDGYTLFGMALDLHISGPGILGHDTTKGGAPKIGWNGGFSVTDFRGVNSVTGNIDLITAGALPPYLQNDQVGAEPLVWNLWVQATAGTDPTIVLDLTLADLTIYSPYYDPAGGPYPDPPGWLSAVEGDLGDMVVYVPEPMTITLLGLGGLLLRYRKKK